MQSTRKSMRHGSMQQPDDHFHFPGPGNGSTFASHPVPTEPPPTGETPLFRPLIVSNKGTGKGKAVPKKRDRFTCVHCREKRIACNRKDPCQQCLDRNIPCDWSGAKPLPASTSAVPAGRNLAPGASLSSFGAADSSRQGPSGPVGDNVPEADAPPRARSAASGTASTPSSGSPASSSSASLAARILANRRRTDADAMRATIQHIEGLLAAAEVRKRSSPEEEDEGGEDGFQRFVRERTVKLDSVDDLASALSSLAVSQAMATAMPTPDVSVKGTPSSGTSERATPSTGASSEDPKSEATKEENKAYGLSRFDSMGLKIIKDITFSLSPTSDDRRSRTTSRSPSLASTSSSALGQAEALFGLGFTDPPIEELLRRLPPFHEIAIFRDLYEQRVAWLCRLLHGPSFEAQVNAIAHRTLKDYLPDPAHPSSGTNSADDTPFSHHMTPLSLSLSGSTRATSPNAVPAHVENLHSLAVLFGVLGLALGMCQGQLTAQEYLDMGLSLTYKGREEQIGHAWLRDALSALRLGNFTETPTLEAIRAIVIIVQMPLYASNGESLGEAVAFASQGLALARKFGMHSDWDEVPEGEVVSAVQKQDRRRVMYGLLDAVWRMRGVVRIKGDIFSPTEYSVRLPALHSDSELHTLPESALPNREDSEFAALNMRIIAARYVQEIGLLFADPAYPPSHTQVMDMDARLRSLEAGFPPPCQLDFDEETFQFSLKKQVEQKYAMDAWAANGTISLANIILHRGLLIARDGMPPSTVAMHRDRVLHYGLRMMCQERTNLFPVSQVPIAYFIINAAIALGVWLLTGDIDHRMSNRVRDDLRYMSSLLKPLSHTSSILRRSLTILNYLIEKDAKRIEQSRLARQGKRARLESHVTGTQSDLSDAIRRQPSLLETVREEMPSSANAEPTDQLSRRASENIADTRDADIASAHQNRPIRRLPHAHHRRAEQPGVPVDHPSGRPPDFVPQMPEPRPGGSRRLPPQPAQPFIEGHAGPPNVPDRGPSPPLEVSTPLRPGQPPPRIPSQLPGASSQPLSRGENSQSLDPDGRIFLAPEPKSTPRARGDPASWLPASRQGFHRPPGAEGLSTGGPAAHLPVTPSVPPHLDVPPWNAEAPLELLHPWNPLIPRVMEPLQPRPDPVTPPHLGPGIDVNTGLPLAPPSWVAHFSGLAPAPQHSAPATPADHHALSHPVGPLLPADTVSASYRYPTSSTPTDPRIPHPTLHHHHSAPHFPVTSGEPAYHSLPTASPWPPLDPASQVRPATTAFEHPHAVGGSETWSAADPTFAGGYSGASFPPVDALPPSNVEGERRPSHMFANGVLRQI